MREGSFGSWTVGVGAVVALVAALAGCSSSSGGDAGKDGGGATADGGDAGGAGAGRDGASAAGSNCVAPGYMGNEKGVGAYCSPDVSCPSIAGSFLICTAGHTSDATKWFCTTPCSDDGPCGTKAYCAHASGGSGCVPFQCGEPPDAGGEDAGADATGD